MIQGPSAGLDIVKVKAILAMLEKTNDFEVAEREFLFKHLQEGLAADEMVPVSHDPQTQSLLQEMDSEPKNSEHWIEKIEALKQRILDNLNIVTQASPAQDCCAPGGVEGYVTNYVGESDPQSQGILAAIGGMGDQGYRAHEDQNLLGVQDL